MDHLIPLVAIVFSIGLPLSIPIVYLVLNHRKGRRLMDLHHAERMAAIERGLELPPLPLDVLGAPRSSRSTLLPGLIWLFVGLAIIAGLRGVEAVGGLYGLSLWGLVPTGVGVAYLIYYFVEDRKRIRQRGAGS